MADTTTPIDPDLKVDKRIDPGLCGCGTVKRPAVTPGRNDDLANHGVRDEDDVFADDRTNHSAHDRSNRDAVCVDEDAYQFSTDEDDVRWSLEKLFR